MRSAVSATLFVDESGDFVTPRGEWVVAGLLVPLPLADACRALDAALAGLPHRCSLSGIDDFHLSELRMRLGPAAALTICERLTSVVASDLAGARFLSSVDFSKTRLTDRERVYRVMLLDTISMVETVMSPDVTLARLDLVVATRTDQNGQRMTTGSDIHDQVLRELAGAVEAGLASRGIMRAALSNNVALRLVYANAYWGTVVADFLANTVYHRREAGPAGILESLRSQRRLSVYESFGGYEERRARVAEREGNWAQALSIWARHSGNSEQVAVERRDAISRLWQAVVTGAGTAGPRSCLDTVIESVHRSGTSAGPEQKLAALQALEAGLSTTTGRDVPSMLFRLRNYMLMLANQSSLACETRRLAAEQEQTIGAHVLQPEDFHWLLDYRLMLVQSTVNDLDWGRLSVLATTLEDLLDNYRTAWALLQASANEVSAAEAAFDQSRVSIRLRSAVCQCRSFLAATGNSGDLATTVARLELLEALELPAMDRSRLFGHRIAALLRALRFDDALTLSGDALLHDPSDWDIFWIARSAGDWVLAHPGAESRVAVDVCAAVESVATANPAQHEGLRGLIAREIGILRMTVGNDRKLAREWLHAGAASGTSGDRSRLSCWLAFLAQAHMVALDNGVGARLRASMGSPKSSLVREGPQMDAQVERIDAASKALGDARLGDSWLLAARLASPY
ncbi:MAG: hypothetical protein NT029_12555 [Armatimonadetes bacterium]|nr:hypothetical protein [Armatimonadota bacterium]